MFPVSVSQQFVFFNYWVAALKCPLQLTTDFEFTFLLLAL